MEDLEPWNLIIGHIYIYIYIIGIGLKRVRIIGSELELLLGWCAGSGR